MVVSWDLMGFIPSGKQTVCELENEKHRKTHRKMEVYPLVVTNSLRMAENGPVIELVEFYPLKLVDLSKVMSTFTRA